MSLGNPIENVRTDRLLDKDGGLSSQLILCLVAFGLKTGRDMPVVML